MTKITNRQWDEEELVLFRFIVWTIIDVFICLDSHEELSAEYDWMSEYIDKYFKDPNLFFNVLNEHLVKLEAIEGSQSSCRKIRNLMDAVNQSLDIATDSSNQHNKGISRNKIIQKAEEVLLDIKNNYPVDFKSYGSVADRLNTYGGYILEYMKDDDVSLAGYMIEYEHDQYTDEILSIYYEVIYGFSELGSVDNKTLQAYKAIVDDIYRLSYKDRQSIEAGVPDLRTRLQALVSAK